MFYRFAAATLVIAGAAVPALAQDGATDKPYPLTRNFIVGVWTDNGVCSTGTTTMNADGNFVAPNGGVGKWTLNGNQFTLTKPDGSGGMTMTVKALDAKTIHIWMPDGNNGRSTRC